MERFWERARPERASAPSAASPQNSRSPGSSRLPPRLLRTRPLRNLHAPQLQSCKTPPRNSQLGSITSTAARSGLRGPPWVSPDHIPAGVGDAETAPPAPLPALARGERRLLRNSIPTPKPAPPQPPGSPEKRDRGPRSGADNLERRGGVKGKGQQEKKRPPSSSRNFSQPGSGK